MTRFRKLTALLLLAAAAMPARAADDGPTPDIPVYREEAKAAGIEHVYGGPWEYFVGGGVAAFDCNGDGRDDLFLAGGANPARLFVNTSRVGGALSFAERPAGLGDSLAKRVLGIHPVDIDSDGVTDLAVLRVGRNLLLKGGPDCSFRLANKLWNFDGGRAWTTGFAATWEKGAKFPTLAFGNYVDRSAPGSPWGTCHDNALYRPEPGDTPRYGERRALSPGYCSLSLMFTDWNRSGTPSLRITNDRHYYRGGEEQLWSLLPGRPPRLYGRSDGWRHLKIWGMGIASHDLDADGYPEYALTSMGDTKLQKLDDETEEGRPVYRDIALDKGATAHRPYTGEDIHPSTGWHADFQDVNNDGLIDLYISKGNVESMPDFAKIDPDNLLLGRWSGKFHEAGGESGIALPRKGRGAAFADFNLDGALDLVVVNREGPVSLFRNLGVKKPGGGVRKPGNWLRVRLVNGKTNRWGIGARINVRIGTRTLVQDLAIGGGHASGTLDFTHFGLGTAERAQIRVRWPDGSWSHSYRVFANQFAIVERGKADAAYWFPAD